MCFLILGRSVELKIIESQDVSEWEALVPQYDVNIHIFGITKYTIYYKKCSSCCGFFLYAVTSFFFFQIKKIISCEKWFNYVVTFFLLFESAKNLGRWDDAERRKKRGWPNQV